MGILTPLKKLLRAGQTKELTVFNSSDPRFSHNPYPLYRHLRDYDPIHRAPSGVWVFTRYTDIVQALKDPRLSNAPAPYAFVHRSNRERHVAADVANGIVAFLDPPEHTRPKRAVVTAFKGLLRGKQRVVEEVVDEVLAGVDAFGHVDFVQEFAIPLAVKCTCRIMGYPEKEAERLKQWSSMFFYLFQAIPNTDTLQQLNDSLRDFRNCTREIVGDRRHNPQDDLVSWLIQAHQDELSEQEIVDNTMLMAADGIENVWSGLASAMATLLTHESELHKMRERSELVDAAVEECLRYESPGQYQGRIALDDIQWGNKRIRKSSVILLVFASANRDPRAFAEPDRFDIERKDSSRHLAFGLGRHACIGGPLVKMVFSAALRKLFNGSRAIRLVNKELAWTARPGHRWPTEVQLEIK